jgi:polyferredoxin
LRVLTCYNGHGDYMRIIQFLLSLILLIWLFIVAWPIFLVLALLLIYAWWRFVRSIRIIKQEVFKEEHVVLPMNRSEDIFDAEYQEKEISHD